MKTYAVHAPGCRGECGGTYVCARCGRLCGWCYGAGDDHPDWCDDCATNPVAMRAADRVRARASRLPDGVASGEEEGT